MRDGLYDGGRKVISFCNVLQHDVFPLAPIMQMAMNYGAESMRCPVEIEFACDINADRTGEFYLLQIRPIVDSKQMLDEDIVAIADERCLLRSHNSLGHGIMDDVCDVVYVKTNASFTAKNNPAIVGEIEKLNEQFLSRGQGYVLIGPGRWGSSDPWLGIPVKWPQISGAKVIVETTLNNYRIDRVKGRTSFKTSPVSVWAILRLMRWVAVACSGKMFWMPCQLSKKLLMFAMFGLMPHCAF